MVFKLGQLAAYGIFGIGAIIALYVHVLLMRQVPWESLVRQIVAAFGLMGAGTALLLFVVVQRAKRDR
jgi:cell division protein FtsX